MPVNEATPTYGSASVLSSTLEKFAREYARAPVRVLCYMLWRMSQMAEMVFQLRVVAGTPKVFSTTALG